MIFLGNSKNNIIRPKCQAPLKKKKIKGRSTRSNSIVLFFPAVIVHMEKYSPGSYRRIHGQKGPACKPGRMPRGRERPYPG